VSTHKAHKIRLDLTNKQLGYMRCACGVARFTYNWALGEWKSQYDRGEKPSAYALKKQFNAIKREEFPWVMEVTKCAPEQAFTNLGKAFSKFFSNIKAGKKPWYPRFKKRGKHNSFYISNDKIDFSGKKVKIPKLGWVRMRESLRFSGKILSAVVSERAGKWFISVNVECPKSSRYSRGPAVGVDVGIKELAVVSDGRVFENPKALKNNEDRLRLLQKSVSRKKKGSSNRKKAVLRLQKQHYKISCIRSDSIHKLTSAITTGVSIIGIESLNVQGMMRNHKLSKALADASLSEILRQIKYKSEWSGIKVVEADRFFPSSKTCSNCGLVKANLTLSDRVFICDDCGFEIDRDLNAAINLKNLAVGSTVTACRLGSSDSDLRLSETTDWAGISLKSGAL